MKNRRSSTALSRLGVPSLILALLTVASPPILAYPPAEEPARDPAEEAVAGPAAETDQDPGYEELACEDEEDVHGPAVEPTAEEPAAIEALLGEPVQMNDVGHGSLLLRTAHADLYYGLPALETRVRSRITGIVARTAVTQRFFNPTDDWVEGVYVFPLPETAAVDTLRMRVGDRVIEGEIQERAEARRTYEQARAQGRRASLLEQERPNLFTVSVANLGPKEAVEVEIELQQTLRYDDGTYELRFPMTVTPRYIPGTQGVTGSAGTGWGANTPEVPDAARITPPILLGEPGAAGSLAAEQAPAAGTVDLRIELSPGFPIDAIESPSHPLTVEALPDWSQTVTPLAGAVTPDRDFVLRWRPAPAYAPQAGFFTEEIGGETYALMMLVPPKEDGAAPLPREMVLVIDTSGSMHGSSMEQAREALLSALATLRPQDRFNIIEFNSHAKRLFPTSVQAEPDSLERARTFVRELKAGGGTEMAMALLAALQNPVGGASDTGSRSKDVRQVIFVTDGSVGNEDQLFGLIHRHLGASRLFTVGIGSAPNSHFMRTAAETGRGTFTHIGSLNEVRERMGQLFAKLAHPVLSDLRIDWDAAGAEAWPRPIPDLYLGEPLVVVARLPQPGGMVWIEGETAGRPWRTHLEAPERGRETAEPLGLDKLWARAKIGSLMDRMARGEDPETVRPEVVRVALDHHLVSKFTSLVAVDRTPVRPESEPIRTKALPVRAPAGWTPPVAPGQILPRAGLGLGWGVFLGVLSLLLSIACLAIGFFGGGSRKRPVPAAVKARATTKRRGHAAGDAAGDAAGSAR